MKGFTKLIVLVWSVVIMLPTIKVYANDNVPVLSTRIYHRLIHVQKDIDAGRYSNARDQLLALLPTTRAGNNYDRAVLMQLLGQVQVQLAQLDEALSAYKVAHSLGVLPITESIRIQRELARLYVQKADYKEAVRILEDLTEQDQSSRFLLAQSYLQLARYHDALEPLEQLIRNDSVPNKSWYEALFFAQRSSNQKREAIETMKQLISLEPSNLLYWRQLSALYFESGDQDRALAVLEAADKQGVISDSDEDYLNLVNLYYTQGAPYKAAVLLERLINESYLEDNITNREKLIGLWTATRDTKRASKSLQELINHSPSSSRWLQLGKLYIEQRDWLKATDALQASLDLDKGGNQLSREQLAESWLWLGIASFESDQTDNALKALQNASTYPDTQTSAEQWLHYLKAIQ